MFGYPTPLFRVIGHPVTWIGRGLSVCDRTLNRDADPPATRRAMGALSLLALLVVVGVAAVLTQAGAFALLPRAAALVLVGGLASSCLAQRSLAAHVHAVALALEGASLETARAAVGAIVGRETRCLDEEGIARAAIESLAENFADGIVAPAFWIAMLGLPGGLLYKAINTADSMIGHRTPRHGAFGFAAAKVDDVVNWPAARIGALWLVAAAVIIPGADPRQAWRIMWRDARGHASPNAGWPEAAMAGAIGARLGGPRVYAGHRVADSFIGEGARRLDAAAIRLALRLYRVACGLNIVAVVTAGLLIARWP